MTHPNENDAPSPETEDTELIVYEGPGRSLRIHGDEAGFYYVSRDFRSGADRVGVYHYEREQAVLELAWDLAAELEAQRSKPE